MSDLAEKRLTARALLDESSPQDAFAAYYTLHHDPARTQLTLNHNPQGKVNGFLTCAQTGMDLFRPVAVLRAATDQVAASLLELGLQAGRPYYLIAPSALGVVINRTLAVSDSEILRVYQLNLNRFQAQINVMVVASRAPNGTPRFEISTQGQVYARAGVNWRSARFAEVYVHTERDARGRGWGRSVLTALCAELVKQNQTPLYVVHDQNSASVNLAESLGFTDTGARDFAAQVMRLNA